jgi:pimeloyl-ACP methyl ester carboxylesterase
MLNRSITRALIAAVAVAAVATGCASGSSSSSTPPPTAATSMATSMATTAVLPVRRSGPIDELLAVDPSGARLHVWCDGEGPVTIVLIPGFGDDGEGWAAVAPTLAQRARVCSYSRFGTGQSDAAPVDQTFTTQADDLHTLLHGVGEVGPYLLVGHSFGGPEAVAFTGRFPDEVDGLVLVDASPVAWPAAVCAVPDDGSEGAAGFRQTCALISDAANNPERLSAPSAFAEVGAIGSLGDVPMTVLTAAQHPRPGLDATQAARLDEVWTDGQEHWATLSSHADLRSIGDTGHYIQLDRPDVVIGAVMELASTP